MSYSISTLLTRNLHDVFGENDPARRRRIQLIVKGVKAKMTAGRSAFCGRRLQISESVIYLRRPVGHASYGQVASRLPSRRHHRGI